MKKKSDVAYQDRFTDEQTRMLLENTGRILKDIFDVPKSDIGYFKTVLDKNGWEEKMKTIRNMKIGSVETTQMLIDYFDKQNMISDDEIKKYCLDKTGKYIPKLKQIRDMKTKYYTPEIEEFFVGFEYEIMPNIGISIIDINKPTEKVERLRSTAYEKCIYGSAFTWDEITDIEAAIKEGKCRVKYLDREDIESLGFKQAKYDENWYDFTEGRYCMYRESENDWRWVIGDEESEISFEGKVKNKSELKKLLKQLGIE